MLDADDAARDELIGAVEDDVLGQLVQSGLFRARPKQLGAILSEDPTCLVLAGRGFGKTFIGAHWTIHRARSRPGCSIALVAETAADARDFMVENGPSSILKQSPADFVPEYEPSKRRLTWPNGSTATTYAGDRPDQVRGFSGQYAWIDELAKYRHAEEVMNQLDYTLREGDESQALITTTPRPIRIIREMVEAPDVRMIRGTSWENAANLSKRFRSKLKKAAGTRTGRQEIEGLILEDVPGALWSYDDISYAAATPDLDELVVAVDPSASKGGDETGIVVAGRCGDEAYVLADLSGQLSPAEWALVATSIYRGDLQPLASVKGIDVPADWTYGPADVIVAEKNQGGQMVKAPFIPPFAALSWTSSGRSVARSSAPSPYRRSISAERCITWVLLRRWRSKWCRTTSLRRPNLRIGLTPWCMPCSVCSLTTVNACLQRGSLQSGTKMGSVPSIPSPSTNLCISAASST